MKHTLALTLLCLTVGMFSANADNDKVYHVKKGDTLWKIARTFQTSSGILKTMNGLDSDLIREGAHIRVPDHAQLKPTSPKSHEVKAGQSLWSISRQYGVSVTQLCEWNGIKDPSRLHAGRKLHLSGSAGRVGKPAKAPEEKTKEQSASPDRVLTMPLKGNGYEIIMLKDETPLKTLALKHKMTVDQINALNGLDLKEDTLLAQGSEIIVIDPD